jgi:hypothetical protein
VILISNIINCVEPEKGGVNEKVTFDNECYPHDRDNV